METFVSCFCQVEGMTTEARTPRPKEANSTRGLRCPAVKEDSIERTFLHVLVLDGGLRGLVGVGLVLALHRVPVELRGRRVDRVGYAMVFWIVVVDPSGGAINNDNDTVAGLCSPSVPIAHITRARRPEESRRAEGGTSDLDSVCNWRWRSYCRSGEGQE